MPKLKTNKAAKKRFKLLKSGKIKRKKAFLRHILTSKSKGRKKALGKSTLVDAADVRGIKQMLPYG